MTIVASALHGANDASEKSMLLKPAVGLKELH